jgi:lipopolysaccharide transport system ATP-binding protein
LRDFMKTGTVLFVSHDTASVKSLCNRVIWLDKGNIFAAGAPKEVCELYLQEFYEEQQGKSSVQSKASLVKKPDYSQAVDQRAKFINASNLRNDLQIFRFNTDSTNFGTGGVTIQDVSLIDDAGNPINWVVGGERVTLQILAYVHQDLESPIAGFWVNDRLGQVLFGDNTCITYYDNNKSCLAGSVLKAIFTFNMPLLPKGDYSVMTSIANGTQQNHVQHHWLNSALMFKSDSTSVAVGLVGVPMLNIELSEQ